MGVTLQQWRSRIGCFIQPVKSKTHFQTLCISKNCISLGLRVMLFLMLVTQGIESNPGPSSRTDSGATGSDVRGRGSSRGNGNGRGGSNRGGMGRRGMGRGFVPEDFFADEPVGQNRRVTRSSQSHTRSLQQHSIDGWLNSQPTNSQPSQLTQQSRTTSPARSRAESGSELDNEQPVQSVQMGLDEGMFGGATPMNVLLDIHRSVNRLNKKFDNIQKSVSDLKKDNLKLKQQNEYLTNKVNELSSSVAELECSSKQNELRYEKLEAQSRRENLRFFEIPETPKETWDQSEEKVRGYVLNTLGIDDTDIKIERAHRLPAKSSPRPLIVKFSHYKDKDRILKRYREIRDARPRPSSDNENVDQPATATVRISEDFPERVRKVRGLLIKFLNQALKAGKNAYIRYDRLIVNDYAYEYDFQKERPVPVVLKK